MLFYKILKYETGFKPLTPRYQTAVPIIQMLKLTIKLIPFRAIKFLFKLLASLASAIVVVSGYLFFISNVERNRDEDLPINSSDSDDSEAETDPEDN